MSFTCRKIYEKITSICPQFSNIKTPLKNENAELFLSDYYVSCIIETITFFVDKGYSDIAKELFDDIINTPNAVNGKLYELLIYHWLISRKILFVPQPTVKKEDCFKHITINSIANESYKADGKIENVYFDIKTFGITLPHIETLREKISQNMTGYIITVSGDLNISIRDLRKYALDKINDIVVNLQQNTIYSTYIYNIPNTGLEVRAIPESQQVASSISEFNAYEWAKNNQFYFMYHGSQFCINAPYIIFCGFDKNITHMFYNEKPEIVDIMLRPLCRRMFMNLNKMVDGKLNNFDGKARSNILISDASKKISAIVFTDLTKPQTYNNCKTWVYVNPNADNPLHSYQINSWFRFNGAFIDDFIHDTY